MHRVLTALALLSASVIGGCGTNIRFDLIRPARVTPPGPGSTYEVVGFVVRGPAVEAPTPVVMGQPPPSTSGGAIVIPVPAPVANAMGAWSGRPTPSEPIEVVRSDVSTTVAQRLSNSLVRELLVSPTSHQVLVRSGGQVQVGGEIVGATYVETEMQEQAECERTVEDRAGRSQRFRVPCVRTTREARVDLEVRLRVWTTDGRTLFEEMFRADGSGTSRSEAALDGSWVDPGEPLQPDSVIEAALGRIAGEASRAVVPRRAAIAVHWRDASGYADNDRARELAGEGEFEASLTIVDQMLGTSGPLEASSREQANLLFDRAMMRLAMNRYAEALADMQAAERRAPGCVMREHLEWTQEIVAEQPTAAAQGIVQPHGAAFD